MPVEIQRRCVKCHQLKDRSEFPATVRVNSKGRRVRIYDAFCAECKATLTSAERRAYERDVRPVDR